MNQSLSKALTFFLYTLSGAIIFTITMPLISFFMMMGYAVL
jgi:ABC-type transport system involved in cytochrome bd biosynthesis fused ATPase/permease subunit